MNIYIKELGKIEDIFKSLEINAYVVPSGGLRSRPLRASPRNTLKHQNGVQAQKKNPSTNADIIFWFCATIQRITPLFQNLFCHFLNNFNKFSFFSVL